MANIESWNKQIKKLNNFELSAIQGSLETLNHWGFFWNEFKGQGLSFLKQAVTDEINERVKEIETDNEIN